MSPFSTGDLFPDNWTGIGEQRLAFPHAGARIVCVAPAPEDFR